MFQIKEFLLKTKSAVVGFFKKIYNFIKNKKDAYEQYYRDQGQEVNWKKAFKRSISIIFRVITRVVSYMFNIVATILLVCIITGIISGTIFIFYLKSNIDPEIDINVLKTEQNATSKFYYYDKQGEPVEIEEERIHGSENRIWVSIDQMPEHLKDAFIAIEDHRFRDHSGVDWYRTLGAVKNFFLPSGGSFGGSTITQQLIKNLTGEDEVTIQRKVQEIFRALYLEKKMSKDEILELYLNTIYLSQGCSGVKTAAYTYFGKDVSELSLVECAALASITKYPTKFDPVQNPDNNTDRRNTVLKTMLQYGLINQREFDEAFDQELVIDLQKDQTNNSNSVSSYYVDAAIEDIISDLMKEKGVGREIASNMLYSGGLNIYLCMDPEVQDIMEKAYTDENTFSKSDHNLIIKPQSAMVVCDPKGDCLGIVGGRGEKLLNRGLNYATQTKRSPGSSIKPLSVYSPALELGLITPGTIVDDIPYSFDKNYNDWPKNVNKTYQGLKTVAYAVRVSLNTSAVRVLDLVGIERSYEFTQKLGLESLEEKYITSSGAEMTDLGQAPLAMGATTLGVTVREMASAYTTFRNNGIHTKSRTYSLVTDADGNTVLNNKQVSTSVFSEETVNTMTKMMEAVAHDKSMKIKKYMPIAGKTGTSMFSHDMWFCGFTPYYVAATWYGFEDPKTLPNTGSAPAVYVFDNVMMKLHEDIIEGLENGSLSPKSFYEEGDLIQVDICASSGLLYNPDTCGLDPRHNQCETLYYAPGTQPTEYCDKHILVDFCADYKCIANDSCPNKIKQALVLETKRSFPVFTYVVDAQYIYRPLGASLPYSSDRYPVFQNAIQSGKYIGITRTDNKAANSLCTRH